jgi:hypothetical protein
LIASPYTKCRQRTFATVSTTSIPITAPGHPRNQREPHHQGGPFWTPITPSTGSFFHADPQSGPYITSRLGPPDYADAGEIAAAFAHAAPERMLWGSDWPHPSEPAAAKPHDRTLLDLLQAWVPDAATRQRVLVDNPAELYGFDAAT